MHLNRAFQSVVLNSGQKMALRAFYFMRVLTKALTCYYISRPQRHLLAAIENNPLHWKAFYCVNDSAESVLLLNVNSIGGHFTRLDFIKRSQRHLLAIIENN